MRQVPAVPSVRVALTGTPIENRLSELWSIFDFLMPGILGGRDAFAEALRGTGRARRAGLGRTPARAWWRRSSCAGSKPTYSPTCPRRARAWSLRSMEGEQAKLYRANQDRLALQISHELPDEFKRSKLQVLAELTKLRQICCDPRLYYEDYAGGSAKLETCMELVAHRRGRRPPRPSVLAVHERCSNLLGERLRADRRSATSCSPAPRAKEERAQLVESASRLASEPVFLISLKAGGAGPQPHRRGRGHPLRPLVEPGRPETRRPTVPTASGKPAP